MTDVSLVGDTTYQDLAVRFRPIIDKIATTSLQREKARLASPEQFSWLREAGFGKLRIPKEYGGFGSRLSDVFRLTAELSTADPNLGHVWRSQYAFIEDRINALDEEYSARILRSLAAGETLGAGWSEKSTSTEGTPHTKLTRTPGGWLVSGRKFYSTGSIYADWITVRGLAEDDTDVVALVSTKQEGVSVIDDWDGFGQQLTGSGSVIYEDAYVPEEQVIPFESRFRYQGQLYQTFLHAVLVGIGRAILRDGVAALKARSRSHPNNVSDKASQDPQLLQVIGDVAARLAAIEGAFAESVRLTDLIAYSPDRSLPSESEQEVLFKASWAAVASAQLVISENILSAASLVFDALGASGSSETLALDRHWRNARTIISHNPRVAKARLLGDLLVNDAHPSPSSRPNTATVESH